MKNITTQLSKQQQFIPKFRTLIEKQTSEQISIASYNVLAQIFTLRPDAHTYCDKRYLDFNYRAPKIIEVIKELNSDIICLQEIDNYGNFYKKELEKLNYSLFYQPKSVVTKIKHKGQFEEVAVRRYPEEERIDVSITTISGYQGIVIGYKNDKFDVLKEDVIHYDLDIPSYLNDENKNYADSKHSAQIVELQSKKSGFKFCVTNTHLQHDPKIDEVKYYQLSKLMKVLSDRYEKDFPLVLCGDYNSLPYSNIVQTVVAKSEPILERIEEPFRNSVKLEDKILLYKNMVCDQNGNYSLNQEYQDSYQNYLGENQFPKFTTYTDNFYGALDHIFYNKKSEKFELQQILELEDEKNIENLYCPNENIPSDHLPLMSVFNIKQ